MAALTGMFFYRLLINTLGPPAVLAACLKGRFGGHWRERFGLRFASPKNYDQARLWFHAASVGEAGVAAAIIDAVLKLNPATDIFLSLGTPAGLAEAAKRYPESTDARVKIMAQPLDFWGAPQRAMARLRPDALIIIETELWPELIEAAKQSGAKVMLVAGRMTARSFKRYGLIKKFMSALLNNFDFLAVAGSVEKKRFAALGAPAEKIEILGTPKYDRLAGLMNQPEFKLKVDSWREKLWETEDGPAAPLLVAGSTHRGEDEMILKVFRQLRLKNPNLCLIMAPRHINRAETLLKAARGQGFTAALAEKAATPFFPKKDIIILDTLGQLTALYALAEVALIGGSLRHGLAGHNPLEPAAVGKPVIFGPWMSSFASEAEALIKAGAARESRPEILAETISAWLTDHEAALKAGQAGLSLVAARKPAAPVLAETLLNFIKNYNSL